MGIAERREREKEALRTQILEAARDILSEEGLHALSMRAIAERIEYSPATIYLYFRDKDELIAEVVREGFKRLHGAMQAEAAKAPPTFSPREYSAMGRAYAKFALENTAYFRVMFEVPGVPQMDCPCPASAEGPAVTGEPSFEAVVQAVEKAVDEGVMKVSDPLRGAVIGWGLMHGLTALYLSGHLAEVVSTHEEFMELIVEAQHSLFEGWRVRDPEATAQDSEEPVETGRARGA